MNFYDRTLGKRDANFHPHLTILGGRSEQIACGGKLTTHAVIDRPSERLKSFSLGRKLIDCHMEAMSQALPTADCVVYSDYLREHQNVVLRLLELVTVYKPSVWTHQVTNLGDRVHLNSPIHNWADVLSLGIFGLTDMDSGALIPNILNVIIHAVVEAVKTNCACVYHLSGPDMVNYIGNMKSELAELYEALHAEMRLSESLEFNLIPVAGVRLAGDEDARQRIDELVDAWLALSKNNVLRGQRIQRAGPSRSQVIITCASEKNRDVHRFRDAALAAPEVFYDITMANTFTQHDIVAGRRFFIHPWAVEAPITQINALITEGERQRRISVR